MTKQEIHERFLGIVARAQAVPYTLPVQPRSVNGDRWSSVRRMQEGDES